MEAIAGTITFGFISHFFGKLDSNLWLNFYKNTAIVDPPDALSSRTLRPRFVATLRSISRASTLGFAAVCAVSVIDAMRRRQRESKETSTEKEKRGSPSDELALQNVDLITSAMSSYYHLLKREMEPHASSWFGANTNPTYDQACTCIGSLVAFRCAGYLPGMCDIILTQSGRFAMRSLPATKKYANDKQREQIRKWGDLYGCHTCGAGSLLDQMRHLLVNGEFKVVTFHSDHIPPNSTVKQLNLPVRGIQRFYPQCKECSSKQSHACKRLKKNLDMQFLAYKIGPHLQSYAAGALLSGGATAFRFSDKSTD